MRVLHVPPSKCVKEVHPDYNPSTDYWYDQVRLRHGGKDSASMMCTSCSPLCCQKGAAHNLPLPMHASCS